MDPQVVVVAQPVVGVSLDCGKGDQNKEEDSRHPPVGYIEEGRNKRVIDEDLRKKGPYYRVEITEIDGPEEPDIYLDDSAGKSEQVMGCGESHAYKAQCRGADAYERDRDEIMEHAEGIYSVKVIDHDGRCPQGCCGRREDSRDRPSQETIPDLDHKRKELLHKHDDKEKAHEGELKRRRKKRMGIKKKDDQRGQGQGVVEMSLPFKEQGSHKNGDHYRCANHRNACAGDQHEQERERNGKKRGVPCIPSRDS
ncbi:MAG: hypothetical protein A4E57_01867 [Syntrophorhabdaceae bacterium PtaU1.Bin034]|nr:MAG: hypothetical protein A4E57_01867 [Syntrophorhabdaceae bacterium PtaU1.Bin034]